MEEILYSTSILRFLIKFQTEVIEFRARQQHVFPKQILIYTQNLLSSNCFNVGHYGLV